MAIDTQKWLLDFLQFYRRLNFFEEYSQLSDEDLALWIRERAIQQGFDLDQENFREDYLVLGLDRERVWETSFDSYDFYQEMGVEYGWQLHVDIVEGWANISRDFFCPVNVKATWKSIKEPIKIDFTLIDIPCSIQVEPDFVSNSERGDYCTLTLTKLAKAIEPFINNTDLHFTIWDLGCAALVMLLTAEEKDLIREGRGANFL